MTADNDNHDPMHTTTAVAKRLGYSDDQIRNLCEAGRFQGAFRAHASGHWRIPESAVVAFVEAGRPKVRRRIAG